MNKSDTKAHSRKMLHDMSNALTLISISIVNLQDILPTLTDAYQVAKHHRPDIFSALTADDLSLTKETLVGVTQRINDMIDTFKDFRMIISEQ